MSSVRALLSSSPLPRLEAQMLLQYVLQVPRVWLITHDTDSLASSQIDQFQILQQQRLAGHPMAYLIGQREFMSHVFNVSPDVLIPRPETELLVQTALDFLQTSQLPAPRVLDLGTGSGAIAVSIALGCPNAKVVATDISLAALELATKNAQQLAAPVEFLSGSWYDALLDQSVFDLIVSNPPYIAAGDPHLAQGDLRFEPQQALTDGSSGFESLTHIISGALAWLKPNGALWMEHGWDQAAAVRRLLQGAGFKQVCSLSDLAGIERISGGHL